MDPGRYRKIITQGTYPDFSNRDKIRSPTTKRYYD